MGVPPGAKYKMTRLKGTILFLQQISSSYRALAFQVIQENEDRIIDLNLQQLYDGLNADGSPIEPEYTPFTVAIKRRKGQPSDRVTLRDTGDFWEGIALKVFETEFELIGTDSKTDKLKAKYGDLIIGLSEESRLRLLNDILIPGLALKFKDLYHQYQNAA